MPRLLDLFVVKYRFDVNLTPLQQAERAISRLERHALRTVPATRSMAGAFGALTQRLRGANAQLVRMIAQLTTIRALGRSGIGEVGYAFDRVLGRAPERRIRQLMQAAPAMSAYTAELTSLGRAQRSLSTLNRPLAMLPSRGATTRPSVPRHLPSVVPAGLADRLHGVNPQLDLYARNMERISRAYRQLPVGGLGTRLPVPAGAPRAAGQLERGLFGDRQRRGLGAPGQRRTTGRESTALARTMGEVYEAEFVEDDYTRRARRTGGTRRPRVFYGDEGWDRPQRRPERIGEPFEDDAPVMESSRRRRRRGSIRTEARLGGYGAASVGAALTGYLGLAGRTLFGYEKPLLELEAALREQAMYTPEMTEESVRSMVDSTVAETLRLSGLVPETATDILLLGRRISKSVDDLTEEQHRTLMAEATLASAATAAPGSPDKVSPEDLFKFINRVLGIYDLEPTQENARKHFDMIIRAAGMFPTGVGGLMAAAEQSLPQWGLMGQGMAFDQFLATIGNLFPFIKSEPRIGTSLRMVGIRLQNMPKKQQEILEEAGIAYDVKAAHRMMAKGQPIAGGRTITDMVVAGEGALAVKLISDVLGRGNLAKIFPARAQNVAKFMAGAYEDTLRQAPIIAAATEGEGAVERSRQILMEGLPGSVYLLIAAFERLNIKMGQAGLTGEIINLVDRVRSVVDWFSNLEEGTQSMLGKFVALGPIALAAGAIGAVVGLMGPLGLAVAALTAVVLGAVAYWQQIMEWLQKWGDVNLFGKSSQSWLDKYMQAALGLGDPDPLKQTDSVMADASGEIVEESEKRGFGSAFRDLFSIFRRDDKSPTQLAAPGELMPTPPSEDEPREGIFGKFWRWLGPSGAEASELRPMQEKTRLTQEPIRLPEMIGKRESPGQSLIDKFNADMAPHLQKLQDAANAAATIVGDKEIPTSPLPSDTQFSYPGAPVHGGAKRPVVEIGDIIVYLDGPPTDDPRAFGEAVGGSIMDHVRNSMEDLETDVDR